MTRRNAARRRFKILLVDDHPVVREGLTHLLQQEPDLAVCGEAASVQEALQAMAAAKPDLVIVDLSLQGRGGLELIEQVKAARRSPPCLALSAHEESLYAERALRAGAAGYIMKDQASTKLIGAIRRILAGGLYVSETLEAKLLHQIVARSPAAGSPLDRLSNRELEVLQRIGQGLGTAEIARQLHLSVKTIETYRAHLKEKLQLANAAALVRYAVRHVLDQPPV